MASTEETFQGKPVSQLTGDEIREQHASLPVFNGKRLSELSGDEINEYHKTQEWQDSVDQKAKLAAVALVDTGKTIKTPENLR